MGRNVDAWGRKSDRRRPDQGSGRFNVSQGVVATVQGLGAAISATVAGTLIVWQGYSVMFLALAGIAVAGFVFYLVAMPETKDC